MSCVSKSKLIPSNQIMENKSQEQIGDGFCKLSVLLELSASDDLEAFKRELEENGGRVDESSFWYGRRTGSKKMGYEERTPLMIASMYGSTKVSKYLVEAGKVDVNRTCGSDKVTALHCAVAGGSESSLEIVKLLLAAQADTERDDANGNKPISLIAPAFNHAANLRRKTMELLLTGGKLAEEGDESIQHEQFQKTMTTSPSYSKEGAEKKEYPIDISLPDINDGIYGTDEFRMYSFKVKPCSRAYSHDWTECPFAHPGENARRRDPRKYPYSCVPCPEFRKGTCQKGDSCDYAHGVFESWLHPAQYRTRLCKDETGCTRKVCFFAHKTEELRPVYASTGSAMPSPKSTLNSSIDMSMMSPLTLSSSSLPMPTVSTPPMSPLAASPTPKGGNLWQNKINFTPPSLQLPGSRLKTTLSARDFDMGMDVLGLGSHGSQQKQLLMEEISRLSSPSLRNSSRTCDLQAANLDELLASLDPSVLSQFQSLSGNPLTPTRLQSSTGIPTHQNLNQRTSYSTNLQSSPLRKPSVYGFDSSAAVAAAMMNARSSAFAKRSQSFIDRGAVPYNSVMSANSNSSPRMSSNLSDWSSPDGKLDWGLHGDELNKLKKSSSFAFRSNSSMPNTNHTLISSISEEPDVSWVNSLVKDVSFEGSRMYSSEKQQRDLSKEMLPPWVEQMYMEHEQMVA